MLNGARWLCLMTESTAGLHTSRSATSAPVDFTELHSVHNCKEPIYTVPVIIQCHHFCSFITGYPSELVESCTQHIMCASWGNCATLHLVYMNRIALHNYYSNFSTKYCTVAFLSFWSIRNNNVSHYCAVCVYHGSFSGINFVDFIVTKS